MEVVVKKVLLLLVGTLFSVCLQGGAMVDNNLKEKVKGALRGDIAILEKCNIGDIEIMTRKMGGANDLLPNWHYVLRVKNVDPDIEYGFYYDDAADQYLLLRAASSAHKLNFNYKGFNYFLNKNIKLTIDEDFVRHVGEYEKFVFGCFLVNDSDEIVKAIRNDPYVFDKLKKEQIENYKTLRCKWAMKNIGGESREIAYYSFSEKDPVLVYFSTVTIMKNGEIKNYKTESMYKSRVQPVYGSVL